MSDVAAGVAARSRPRRPVVVTDGWEVSGRGAPRAGLTITDCTPLTKVQVRAPIGGQAAAALGVRFGRAARDAAARWSSAPGRGSGCCWRPRPGAALDPERIAARARDPSATWVDLTHGRALDPAERNVRRRRLLAKVCGIDLSDDDHPGRRRVPDLGRRGGHRRDPRRPGRCRRGHPRPTCCTASDPPASTCSTPCSARAPSSASKSTDSGCPTPCPAALTPRTSSPCKEPKAMAFPSDLEIARSAQLKPIDDIASEIGLGMHLLEPYGEQVMKIKLAAIEELADRPEGEVRGGHGGHPDAARRGQDHHDRRARAGLQAHRQAGHDRDQAAVDGPDVRHQGRRRGRRVQPGGPDGGRSTCT